MTTRLAILFVLAIAAPATAAPKKGRAPTAEQKEADRHFKSGVALFKEAKFAEALAEFERAYEIAPHPLVLYNIAGCHRELSHYAEAVRYYRRFLAEGKAKVPTKRLAAAQKELDGILQRVARITVAAPDGAMLTIDGAEIGTMPVEMPVMVAPGEHRIVVHSQGMRDAERTVRVASGDVVDVAMKLVELPVVQDDRPAVTVDGPVAVGAPRRRRFAAGAAFGTNLRQVADTGAPTLALAAAVTSRIEVGVDAILVAYAVMPSLRVRLVGDAIAVHAAIAMPVSFKDGEMSETFVAGAVGLGLRIRVTPALALRIESFASFAGEDHGTTVPAFVGGELWF